MSLSAPPSSSAAPPVRRLPAEAYARMATVLRLGLGLALAILGVGLVAHVVAYPNESSSSTLSSNPILPYLSVPGLASGLAAGSVDAFLTLGLLVLVATPIVRVLSGFYYFRRGGERAMTAITLVVFAMLMLGILVIGPLVR